MGDFNWPEEAEKQWDQRAKEWHERSKEMWETGSRKDIIPFISRYIAHGSKIVDLGCGDGYGSKKLAANGYKVTGIDMSEEMLELARQEMIRQEVEFQKLDLCNTEKDANSFELGMAINSLEWIADPLKALVEMERIIKDGGYLCIGILGPTAAPRRSSYKRLFGDDVVCNTMMPWELEKMATEMNWNLIDEFGVFKKATNQLPLESLPKELKQAISFMWVFLFQVKKRGNGM